MTRSVWAMPVFIQWLGAGKLRPQGPLTGRTRLIAFISATPLLSLTSCDEVSSLFVSPEVRACEYFLKDRLQSPASYQRISETSWDEPVSASDLRAMKGDRSLPSLPNRDPALRMVGVIYDAQNAYGTPLRLGEVCAFETDGGKLPDADMMMSRARLAASTARMQSLAEAGIVTPRALPMPTINPPHPCCIR